jgi:hypothetical protein
VTCARGQEKKGQEEKALTLVSSDTNLKFFGGVATRRRPFFMPKCQRLMSESVGT